MTSETSDNTILESVREAQRASLKQGRFEERIRIRDWLRTLFTEEEGPFYQLTNNLAAAIDVGEHVDEDECEE